MLYSLLFVNFDFLLNTLLPCFHIYTRIFFIFFLYIYVRVLYINYIIFYIIISLISLIICFNFLFSCFNYPQLTLYRLIFSFLPSPFFIVVTRVICDKILFNVCFLFLIWIIVVFYCALNSGPFSRANIKERKRNKKNRT